MTMNEEKQNVFSSLNSKTTFILGLICGILAICTIGFFVLLVTFVQGKSLGFLKAGANQAAAVNQVADNNQIPPSNAQETKVSIALKPTDHLRGSKNAPVAIVEFSDYQCPFCQKFHVTMQQVMSEYGDKVAWVYKHFPLDQLHPQARNAAEAAECVAEQAGDSGFWDFTDYLFSNQEKLSPSFYEEAAARVGFIELDKFKDCVASRKYQAKVEADYQAGLQYGVNGTPGNFINGTPVRGALPYEAIKQLIEAEL